MNWIIQHFLHWTGSDNAAGPEYGFFSGFGSDLTELALVGALWKHANCHAMGCWRVGLHPISGTPYKTCKKHHPHGGNTVEHIHAVHAASQADPDGA